MNLNGEVPVAIKLEAWMQLENPEQTIDEAVRELEQAGNIVLEIDRENRRIKVADYTEDL